MAAQTIRVVQWTTGNIGVHSVRAVLAHPDLELVGCFAWSRDKVGRDVGELCGVPPIGVTATDDVEAVLALQPDCVVYNPKWHDLEQMVQILEAGIDVVSTCWFITGHHVGRERIEQACRKGGSTIFGSGISPGFVNLLGLVSTTICDRVDALRVLESVDSSVYDAAETEMALGFGHPMDHPDLPAMARKGTIGHGDAVQLMALGLGIELDEIRFGAEFARAPEAVDLGTWKIDAGTVGGIFARWEGMRDGKPAVEMSSRYRKGRRIDPDWKIENAWIIEVDGRPCVRNKVQIFPGTDHQLKGFKAYQELASIVTAMPAIHAIPHVVAAAPGIATYVDLPSMAARGTVPA
jgi:hypothetical protein